jgi:hypothetical protein
MVITIPTVLGSMSGAKEKAEEIFVAEVRKALGKYIDYEMKVSLTSNNFIKSDKINEYDLYEIRIYIEENPIKWTLDKYYE